MRILRRAVGVVWSDSVMSYFTCVLKFRDGALVRAVLEEARPDCGGAVKWDGAVERFKFRYDTATSSGLAFLFRQYEKPLNSGARFESFRSYDRPARCAE